MASQLLYINLKLCARAYKRYNRYENDPNNINIEHNTSATLEWSVDSEMCENLIFANSKFLLIWKIPVFRYLFYLQELANNSELKNLRNKDHAKFSESTVLGNTNLCKGHTCMI